MNLGHREFSTAFGRPFWMKRGLAGGGLAVSLGRRRREVDFSLMLVSSVASWTRGVLMALTCA